MFYIGQKVICIDDSSGHGVWASEDAIYKDQIYTIRRVFIWNPSGERGIPTESHLCVWLDEVARGPVAIRHWGPDVGYGAHRFAPLSTKETDISVFKKMLIDVKEPELT